MAKKNKDIKIEADVDGNKLKIEKTDEKLDVTYDGKIRDFEFHKDTDSKNVKYDGKKLDVEINKTLDKTEVKVEAETGILRFVGKLLAKVLLRKGK